MSADIMDIFRIRDRHNSANRNLLWRQSAHKSHVEAHEDRGILLTAYGTAEGELAALRLLLAAANAEVMAHRHAADRGVTDDMVQAAIDEYDNVYDGPECRRETWMCAALEAAMRERDGAEAPATKATPLTPHRSTEDGEH